MTLFKYTVANNDGKKLNGSIDAIDEQAARQELNNLGFSILEISKTETPHAEIAKDHVIFEFEALDKTGKNVKGSIPGKTIEEVQKRLKKEYELRILALWQQGATPQEIELARENGEKLLNNEAQELQNQLAKNQINEEEIILKEKIEIILKKVYALLKKFEKDIDKDIYAQITKKIDKLLRIKHSNNLEYIYSTAEELLLFIQEQQEEFQKKGLKEKKFELKVETNAIFEELKSSKKSKSLTEDISSKIQKWQKTHANTDIKDQKGINKIISKFLNIIYGFTNISEEEKVLKEEIKNLKSQRFEYYKLYFKEPTKEYKDKVKLNIKNINVKIQNYKEKIKELRYPELKVSKTTEKAKKEENFLATTLNETNTITGWILTLYLAYYFITLILSTKDIGITNIPNGFILYNSHIFKYLLILFFFLHSATAIKINFFKDNKIANFIITTLFILITITTLLNI